MRMKTIFAIMISYLLLAMTLPVACTPRATDDPGHDAAPVECPAAECPALEWHAVPARADANDGQWRTEWVIRQGTVIEVICATAPGTYYASLFAIFGDPLLLSGKEADGTVCFGASDGLESIPGRRYAILLNVDPAISPPPDVVARLVSK